MRHNVVLADDSLTIQKVINITLANEPYEITNCEKDSDIDSVVGSLNPAIVLLDFNLSENKDGYALCSQIKSICPSTKVLMMYGTFDSIDDSKLSESGADEKIIKPFDGSKFIEICRSLAGSSPSSASIDDDVTKTVEVQTSLSSDPDITANIEIPSIISADATAELRIDEILSTDESDALDSWTVDDSNSQVEEVPGVIGNPLEEMASEWETSADAQPPVQAEDWKIEVPSIISLEPANDIPLEIEDLTLSEEMNLPSDDDLEYPDMNAIYEDPTSELIPASELNEIEVEDLDEDFSIDGIGEGSDSEEDVKKIESQIEDEVGDFWAVDESAVIEQVEEQAADVFETEDAFEATAAPIDLAALEEEVKHEQESEDDSFDEIETADSIDLAALEQEAKQEEEYSDIPESEVEEAAPVVQAASFTLDDNAKQTIETAVEAYLQERAQAIAEKVLWEIMPDIAENVIKNELSKITSEVMKDN